MKFSELPQDVQEALNAKRKRKEAEQRNTATEILLYNPQFTRFFWAKRHSYPSQYWSFGGGNYWEVHYGEVVFCKERVMGSLIDWGWGFGKEYRKANGVDIPKQVERKAEIIEIIKGINIFDLNVLPK